MLTLLIHLARPFVARDWVPADVAEQAGDGQLFFMRDSSKSCLDEAWLSPSHQAILTAVAAVIRQTAATLEVPVCSVLRVMAALRVACFAVLASEPCG